MSQTKHRLLRDLVMPITTWNPRRSQDGRFDYIDLSAVDQDRKLITEARSTPTGEAPSRARQLVRAGDVLVSTVRPNLNGVAVVPKELDGATASTGFCVLRPGAELDGRFLFHWVRCPSFVNDMVRKATGASYPAVSDRIIHESSIPLPPIPEQRMIAEVLDRGDDLCAKRREALARLGDLTQSIFLHMFGDPVANPKEWPLATVGEHLILQQYGPRFYNEAYSKNGVPIARITDLDPLGNLDFSSMPKLDVAELVRGKFALRPGDLIFARSGATVGKLALIREGDPECIAGAYFIRMRFDNDILPEYAAALLRTKSVQAIIWAGSQQSAQQNFSGPGLRSLPLPIPPIDAQQEFARKAAAVTALKESHQTSVVELDALFASLQDRAFRGLL